MQQPPEDTTVEQVQQDDYRPEEEEKPKAGWRALVMPALVCVVITFGMLQFWAMPQLVSKSDFTTNLQNVAKTISDLQATQESFTVALTNKADATQVAALSNDIASLRTEQQQQMANLQVQLDDIPTKAQLDNIPTSADITAAVSEALTPINDSIQDINDQIDELQEEAVVAEEAAAATDIADYLEIDMGYSKYFIFSDNTTVVEQALYFQIENQSDYDIENVEIELVLHSRGVPINLNASLCQVTSGYPLQWQPIYIGNGVVVLKGITPTYTSGLEIDSDDKEDVIVSIKLGVNEEHKPVSDVRFYVEGKITDYDVVE